MGNWSSRIDNEKKPSVHYPLVMCNYHGNNGFEQIAVYLDDQGCNIHYCILKKENKDNDYNDKIISVFLPSNLENLLKLKEIDGV